MKPGSRGDVLRAFTGLNTLVIGDAMVDRYIRGAARRLSQEAPVPVVDAEAVVSVPGGAAHAAMDAAALGARVTLLSVAGCDSDAGLLDQELSGAGIESHLAREPGRRTLRKTRVVAGNHVIVRVDEGTTASASHPAEMSMLAALAPAWSRADVVVISDYAYGTITPAVLESIGCLQAAMPRILAIDSKDLRAYCQLKPDLVKPNYAQALALCRDAGLSTCSARAEVVLLCATPILEQTGARIAAVTLDTEGAIVLEKSGATYRFDATPADNLRSIGAGDTYLVTFALALAAGAETHAAAEVATAAAEFVVRAEGTTCCDLAALLAASEPPHGQVSDTNELVAELEAQRTNGRRIVLTSGVFDILHAGHIEYLQAARRLGDLLVVGLNSDASVRRLKGPARPVNTVQERADVLRGLAAVDHVVVFDEDTPERLIRNVRPHIYVKGGDYTEERLPEAAAVRELGGQVVLIDYVDGHSTTTIIDRIRARTRSAGGLPEVAG